MRRLIRPAFWAAVVFTFVMATLPEPPHWPGEPSDKILHMLAFACLAALGSAAYARVPAVRIVLALATFGVSIEVAQLIPVLHRDAELLDWVADVAAASAVLLVIRGWRGLRQ